MILVCTVLFLLSSLCYGQSGSIKSSPAGIKKTFPVSAFAAFTVNTMLAQAHEYVLTKGHILSDLIWPLTPSVSYTLHGGLYLPKGIHIEGNVSFMQPMQTGTMIDTDFFNIELSPPRFGMTHFSEHNCKILEGIRSTVKLGLQLPMSQSAAMQKNGITLMTEPMISLHYSKISWYAYDGYLQYGKQLSRNPDVYEEWTPYIPKTQSTGPAIAYQQQLIIPAVGIGFEADIPHKLRIFTDFHITAEVLADGEDIHYAKNKRFIDIMDGGWALHGGVRLTWEFLPYCGLFVHFLYEHSITQEGYTLIYSLPSNILTDYSLRGTSGTSLSGGTFSAGIAFLLGR
ncbi:MAG: omptin family outer membrane protease [Treponema sp.]